MVTAPTSLRGYATDDVYYGGVLTDALEHIPDVSYPLSVPVYGRMRREPTLAAVLAAYTLPIRRASWSLDPAGCRPEVVQLIADDLGIPVAGRDEPGAARTRGVSWAEHLRSALSYLTFGHAGHELLAEMRDGQARLAGLFDRVQSTIQEIHVDRQGTLLGISQELRAKAKSPQIKADRLVWYVHEREGANWAGTSLLRPAYGVWLIKQEMLRTHSTANRRWGAGVPVMEALPGTAPTPAQMSEAMQLAAAARAGEQAGAATPPGFVMKILGLSGAVPDTLSFIKYCDASMGRMALAGFLDLGSGDTGSYALAKSFVDLFLLNIQTIADHLADTVTRQIAARVVEWNWGDEPVPAVQVADVGTKHEITAEALSLLLGSGALSADPGLEAQVRRMYRLPEREDAEAGPTGRIFESDISTGMLTRNERRAMFNLPPVEGGDALPDTDGPSPQPAAPASQPESRVAAKRRSQADGQLALPIAAAADDDEANRVQVSFEAALAGLLAAWPALVAPLVDDLVGQVEQATAAGDLLALTALDVSVLVTQGLTAAVTAAMAGLAADAAGQVVVSARAHGADVPPVQPDEGRLAELAAVTVALLASGYTSAAARRAMLAPAVEAGGVVRTALVDMSAAGRGMVADHLGAALSTAQGQGRLAVLAAVPAQAYVGSESQEATNRCANCTAADGKRYATLAEALRDRPNGMQLATCAGGARCRGALLPIW